MKTIFLSIVFILVTPCVVFTEPYLVTDPPANPVLVCELEINGVVQAGTCITHTNGMDFEWLDLAGFAPGNYKFRGRWQDASGWWSEWSNPFVVTKPGKPGNIRIK